MHRVNTASFFNLSDLDRIHNPAADTNEMEGLTGNPTIQSLLNLFRFGVHKEELA